MKSLCTRGILYFTLALLVIAAAACTQSRPAVPTPTLIPLANETIVAPPEQPTPIIIEGQPTASGGNPTLVPPPVGNETTVPPVGGETPIVPQDNITPVIVEPTLLPTPTTVGDTGQPVATPEAGGQQPPAGGACSNPYTVQPGDWLYKIARNCGITYEQLVAANPGITLRPLFAGQKLNMPAGSAGGNQPPPTAETGGQQPPSGGCSNPYVVQRGDTLYSIARKCGTTAARLQQLNGIPVPDYIFPGQQLRTQ